MSSTARSLSDIEAELDRNRDSMGGTLDALQHRLSTDNLFERGFTYLRDTGADEFLVNLGHSVQRNPLPISLLGVGIVWLMVNGSDSARGAVAEHTPDVDGQDLRDLASRAGERTGSAATSAREGIGQATERGREGMQRLSSGTRRGAARVGNAGRRGVERTADGVGYMLHEQPLITAALGLALGAVVAASLPHTRREDDMMGDTRDEFMDYARDTGEEKVDQVRSVADSALGAAGDAARSEADRQGLGSADADSGATTRSDSTPDADSTAGARPVTTTEL